MCELCTPDMNASVIRLWWEAAGITGYPER